MARPADTLRSKPALPAALALWALLWVVAGSATPPALGAQAPRVTLSVPAEVTPAATATATGRVLPSQRGRVLLRVWRAGAWRLVAVGRVRHGRFRISFVLRGPAPSASRLRATLVRSRRPIASSAARKVRLRPTAEAPESPAAATPAAPTAPPIAVAPAEAVDPAPGGAAAPEHVYWGAWIGPQLTGTAAPWDMNAVSKFEQLTGKPLSMIEFSTPFADCSTAPCSYFGFPRDQFAAIRAHGAIPFFSWGSQSIPGSSDQPEFQLADIIAGKYDSYIRNWAMRAAEWGHPFFLRYGLGDERKLVPVGGGCQRQPTR